MTPPLIVLAAGLSTRFGRLKQLYPIGPGGEAVLDYNVFDAVRAGFGPIYLVVRDEILEPMRRHVTEVFGEEVPFRFVCQSTQEIPPGFRAPPDRRKPWGTGQAVLQTARDIDGPFAVCNSDDLYGPGAFEILHRHMASAPSPRESALVGYRLADTLSGSGEVARGVCVLRREGTLERITEIREVYRKDGWVTGVELDGEPVELTGNETVSMNLWGLLPEIVPALHRQFVRFLQYWGADTQHEFFLSTAVSNLIRLGGAEVRVYAAPDPWFGMTHPADRDRTRVALAGRIAEGIYPARLGDGLGSTV